jgi:hypothetical protein
VVSYLIAIAIWPYRLRRAADWARGCVANADAPLAYELATALAGRVHLDISSLRSGNVAEREIHMSSSTGSTRDQRAGLGIALAGPAYLSLPGPAITPRLLALQSRSVWDKAHQLDNGSDVVLLTSNGREAAA